MSAAAATPATTTPFGLTPQQQRVVAWVANGYTNIEIASFMWLSEQTVKWHLTQAMRRMNARNRVEVAVTWVREVEPLTEGRPRAGDTA